MCCCRQECTSCYSLCFLSKALAILYTERIYRVRTLSCSLSVYWYRVDTTTGLSRPLSMTFRLFDSLLILTERPSRSYLETPFMLEDTLFRSAFSRRNFSSRSFFSSLSLSSLFSVWNPVVISLSRSAVYRYLDSSCLIFS